MDYLKIYNKLIESRRFRLTCKDQYYENHHILPKCMKGTNKKENLIPLTPKEHFIAHMLLFRFTTGKDKVKMGFALHMLSVINEHQEKRYINSRVYSNLKLRIYKEIRGINHPSFGKKYGFDFKEKIRQSQLGKTNSMYGKPPWNKGKRKEDNETLKKISETMIKNPPSKKPGRKKYAIGDERRHCSEAGKLNYSNAKKGQIPWNKGKVGYKINSIKRKGKPQKKIKCPWCEATGGVTMYRWHFNNCKIKKEYNNGI